MVIICFGKQWSECQSEEIQLSVGKPQERKMWTLTTMVNGPFGLQATHHSFILTVLSYTKIFNNKNFKLWKNKQTF